MRIFIFAITVVVVVFGVGWLSTSPPPVEKSNIPEYVPRNRAALAGEPSENIGKTEEESKDHIIDDNKMVAPEYFTGVEIVLDDMTLRTWKNGALVKTYEVKAIRGRKSQVRHSSRQLFSFT